MELLECTLTVDDLDEFVAQLGRIGDRHDVTIQAFDARYVVDRSHLECARKLADRAIAREENIARDRAVEVLLYAAGRRQINRALEMGINVGETDAIVLIDADSSGNEGGHKGGTAETLEREAATRRELVKLDAIEPTESILEAVDTEAICSFYDVTDTEQAATDASLSDLVRERVALLEVEK
ncbi:KEOPS complex subunit Cgi121 [Natronorubrum daqingense]|uniref:KEOPS complex component n=1 Tax=Natronorubrum daqingense TaxID=588898 RepID=A0A1N7F861_9EURY|nr:KEOPS complex subunit Cgi121 [Natronorubrum daqingense]APX97600.1 KEOPS complex component [Natronorubrum daqingense]SIR96500.1 KEOPS complex subunit Cgi121 [Natronorubrum daqingense]